jgi:hypothetical protein
MSKDRIKEEQLLEESLNQSYTLGISTGLDIACVLVSKRAQTAFVRNRDELANLLRRTAEELSELSKKKRTKAEDMKEKICEWEDDDE